MVVPSNSIRWIFVAYGMCSTPAIAHSVYRDYLTKNVHVYVVSVYSLRSIHAVIINVT